MNVILYIHGKGGSAAESEHFKPLFPDCEVTGLDYQTFSPWDTGKEIRIAVEELKRKYENVILIASSIGAFFSMNADIDDMIQKAYFISPIVDTEKLITDMMKLANVTEQKLESEGVIRTDFGEDLSWQYLSYVRSHPIKWRVPTQILYGSNDHLTSLETITDFANKHQANLTVMEGGEHWFHTEEQMVFLDKWIKNEKRNKNTKALVVIDIQNDITKHYRDIVDNINAAVDWAVNEGMHVVYIKHNNITVGTRTFKPGTRGEELEPELKVVSDNIFVKTKSNALTSEAFSKFIAENGITEFYIAGADATACVKSTCFNMRKAGYTVHVFSDCVTSYDLKKIQEMLAYYEKQGCELKNIKGMNSIFVKGSNLARARKSD